MRKKQFESVLTENSVIFGINNMTEPHGERVQARRTCGICTSVCRVFGGRAFTSAASERTAEYTANTSANTAGTVSLLSRHGVLLLLHMFPPVLYYRENKGIKNTSDHIFKTLRNTH